MKNLIKVLIAFAFLINQSAFAITEINNNWWARYGDSTLTENLNIMYAQNKDLKIAAYKTKQMQDVVKMSFAKQLPQVSLMGDISHTFESADAFFGKGMKIPSYHQTNFLLPLTLNYEIDIWGKNYLATKAVKQEAKMIAQDEELIKTLVESNFAACYFNLIKVDELLKNQTKIVEIQKNIVSMVNKKYKNGLANKTEVLQTEQALTLFTIELNNLKEKQELLQSQLYVMLGDKNRTEISRSSINGLKTIATPEQISAEVIADRPDYIKSEIYVKKLGYDVRVAKRDFLPKFILYGNVGFNMYANSMPQKTFLANVGVLPQFDLFTGGYKLARYRYIKTECKKALKIYEKTVLTSIQEVNDALYKMKTADKDYIESIKNDTLQREQYSLISKKYNIGATSYLNKLIVERNSYLTQDQVIACKIDYLISSIGLYKALGGKNLNF